METAVAQWLRCYATNRKVAGSIPAGVSGFFIDIKSFLSPYCAWVDSASNINEYQEYFLGGKGGRCVRLTTYHHPVPLSRNLGTSTPWNPLGPSGTVTGLVYVFNNYLILCWLVGNTKNLRKYVVSFNPKLYQETELRFKVRCALSATYTNSFDVPFRKCNRQCASSD